MSYFDQCLFISFKTGRQIKQYPMFQFYRLFGDPRFLYTLKCPFLINKPRDKKKSGKVFSVYVTSFQDESSIIFEKSLPHGQSYEPVSLFNHSEFTSEAGDQFIIHEAEDN